MAEIECLGDEDDFMSDKWTDAANDVKPSISSTWSSVRERQVAKNALLAKEKVRQKHLAKKLKKNERIIVEKARTEIALQTKIPETNKGFQMMAKMGYKAGMSLGSSTAENPLIEPLKPKLSDAYKPPKQRLGIGIQTKEKEIVAQQQKRIEINKIETAKLEEQFKSQQKKKYSQRHNEESDLKKAQQICEELDNRECLMCPKEYFHSPPEVDPEDEDEEDPYASISTSEKLTQVLAYLKKQHFYCVYCAISFENLEDFDKNCPGPNRDDH